MTDFDRKATVDFLGAYPHQVISKEKELTGEEDACMELFSFIDRDSYLAWVAQWKVLLKQIEAEIRRLKVARKGDTSGSAQMYRDMYRHHAHAMIIRRHLARKVSMRMRAARLAQAA